MHRPPALENPSAARVRLLQPAGTHRPLMEVFALIELVLSVRQSIHEQTISTKYNKALMKGTTQIAGEVMWRKLLCWQHFDFQTCADKNV